MKELVALVDCSAFYCSCERVFRPELRGKPVCVLSNNDGCVISLTPEVKELGIYMGTPYFEVRDLLKSLGVAVFSSNYCLYADMSRRVMNVLRSLSDSVEQYSIDEAFIRVTADPERIPEERVRLVAFAKTVHEEVMRHTGIPVRVSIAETKTLAKVGSDYTKTLMKRGEVPAVCFWEHPEKESVMQSLPVGSVWGIGRKWSAHLESEGVRTAGLLRDADVARIRKKYGIVMERVVHELRGAYCIPLEMFARRSKSIVRSRMFAKKMNDPRAMFEAVSNHVTRGAEKLRAEGLEAREFTVFIATGRHASPKAWNSVSRTLIRPTSDTIVLTTLAREMFKECFKSHAPDGRPYRYSKVGIVASNLSPKEYGSTELFPTGIVEHGALMRVMDSVNERFGKHALILASSGTPEQLRGIDGGTKKAASWAMKRHLMSPRYTTVWDELLRVKL